MTITRALIRKPSLLILDEATSNLDQENEKKLLIALDGLPQEISILIIAHHQSTINADKIYLMDHGQIIESGTYPELIKENNGRFRELFQGD